MYYSCRSWGGSVCVRAEKQTQFYEHFVLTRRLYTVMYNTQWPAVRGTTGLGDRSLWDPASQRPWRFSSMLHVGTTCQSPCQHRPFWAYLWRRRRRPNYAGLLSWHHNTCDNLFKENLQVLCRSKMTRKINVKQQHAERCNSTNGRHHFVIYSVSQKNPPCDFLAFSPKRLGIFCPNFTHLLYVPIYARLQIFI